MTTHAHGHKSKWKTVLMIAAPIIVGIAIIYLLNRPKNTKAKAKASDALKNSAAASTKKAIDPASFPLKQGSKGDLVKALQEAYVAAYGSTIVADGIWGPKTQAALLTAGIGKISSQTDYDAAIHKLQSVKSIALNSSRADDLVAKWKNDPTLQLMTTGKTAAMYGISVDSYGAVVTNDNDMGLAAGYKYNRNDYQLQEGTKNGYVIVNVPNGPKAGLKKVLASDITVG